jgi:hypothetical protein
MPIAPLLVWEVGEYIRGLFNWPWGTASGVCVKQFCVSREQHESGKGQWTLIIGSGERAIYTSEDGSREVTVFTHLFTPKGLMYSLHPEKEDGKWMVVADAIQPMHGATRMVYVDLMTGEARDNAPAVA